MRLQCKLLLVICAVCLPVTCLAVKKSTKPNKAKSIQPCTQLFRDGSTYGPTRKGTSQPACLWKTDKLTVTFLDGTPEMRARVEKIAKEWEQYSGIKFDFGTFDDADVRVSFELPGNWSYVGTCRPPLKKTQPTINLHELSEDFGEDAYRRVTLHEFGHTLGMVHEHQNPAVKIKWNEEIVYAFYKLPPNEWSREKTYENVFKKLSETETNHTEYDPDSIMEYPIAKSWTKNGFSIGWNHELSELDKKFMREMYHHTD